MNVTAIAVYAGNLGSNPPAHTALVDYVFDAASPIVPEDGGGAGFTLDLAATGMGGVSADPDQAVYACGDLVTLTATAQPGWSFTGWQGDVPSSSLNPLVIQMDADRAILAVFEQGLRHARRTGVR